MVTVTPDLVRPKSTYHENLHADDASLIRRCRLNVCLYELGSDSRRMYRCCKVESRSLSGERHPSLAADYLHDERLVMTILKSVRSLM